MQNENKNDLNLLNNLVDSIQEGVVVLENDLRIKRVNKRILSKVTAKEAVIGSYCYKILRNRETPCTDCPVLKTFESAEPNKEILKNPLNEKTEPIYEITTSPIINKNGEVELVIESYIDITHLTQFENRLFESEKKYRNVFEQGLAAIVVADDMGNYISANKAASDLFGYSINELKSMKVADLHTIVQPVAAKRYEAYLKKGEETGEFDFITKDGVNKVAIYRATRIKENFNVSMLFDISKQKNIDKELLLAKKRAEESELYYRQTFEEAPVGVANVKPNGQFTRINNRFCEIIGYTEEELLKIDFASITFPDDLKKENVFISKVLNNEINSYTIDKRFIHKKGHIIWVNLYSNSARDVDGNLLFAIASITDITDKIKLQKEIIAAKEKAEESDRLKTAFLQNMSHEIRTPLNSILGFSERLSASKVTEEKKQFYTDIIIKSGFQLLSIVNDVLTISAIDTGQEKVKKENVSINSLISDIEEVFKQQIDHQLVKLKSFKPLSDNDAHLLTDKTKLIQILTNLISNAIKFTSTGVIEFGYTLKNSKIEFFVKDNGIGIDNSKHEVIFERFVQAEESIHIDYGGNGLGLSICKGFVKLLGGRIWVESEPGEGATFYFTIPYKPSKIESCDETLSTNQGKIKQNENKTVLVAEDLIFNYIYLEEHLKELNYKVIHAKNGKEAVEICRTNESIDIVIMDIRMPVMDGHKATMLIKEFRPSLKIIAQTAHAINVEIEKFGKAFDDYLTKPITSEKLTSIMNKHLNPDK